MADMTMVPEKKENKAAAFFGAIGNFFRRFGLAVADGDWAVKLSLVLCGAGYFRRKQIVRGILVMLLEIGAIAYTVFIGAGYIAKLPTLGTVQQEMVYNPDTMQNEMNNYDNSLLILLFGAISIVTVIVSIILWMANEITVYHIQKDAEAGRHVNTFRDDLHDLINKKFHITLLFFPILGIIIFNIFPLIVMVAVGFTNYDRKHMPPAYLFNWIGLANFKALLGNSLTMSFGYSFRKILVWTLIWAVLATFTTYFGGILLSLLINSKYTHFKKMWRTLFVVTIAIPQFVTLLMMRSFYGDTGIVNTFLEKIGLVGFLKDIGLISTNYIPFLTSPGWAKVTIVIINIWVGVPYLMLITTGVLMNIPKDLVESAEIDGANKRQIFRHITMPYMLFITGPYLVTQFTANINNFNVIYLLTNNVYTTTDQKLAASSGQEVDLLVTWLFRLTSDKYNYKMASVIGIMVFLICAVFTLIAFNFLIKDDREEMFR